MQITNLTTYLVDPGICKNWLFVKLETDEGITGWGEAYTQLDRDQTVEAHVKAMARYLVGRDPFDIKHFTHVMYADFAAKRGSMEFYSALSGIEHAMWDIVGKALDAPVYRLLGGACRDQVRVYANYWYLGAKTPDEFARMAVRTVEAGFTALKFDPFPGPWRAFINREAERKAVETVKLIRDAVGPDIDLLIEVHRRLAPMHAVRVAREMEPLNPFWYEEPVSPENLVALAEVRRQVNIPIVTGEALYAKFGFREVFERGAADIINPDACNVGGLLELKEIAAMAEPYHVAVAPHNYNSTTLGLAATIQMAACIPNFLITEYFVPFKARGDEISVEPFEVEGGTIRLPDRPGLGIDLDEEALARHPRREFPPRTIPRPEQESLGPVDFERWYPTR